MNVIVINGQKDSGKTTTAGYVYSDLLSVNPQSHTFDGNVQTINGLMYDPINSATNDFVADMRAKGKQVTIISAGDIWEDLKKKILHRQLINPKCDVLIVTARTGNSVTLRELRAMFGKSIVHTERIVKQLTSAKSLKQTYVNNIIANI